MSESDDAEQPAWGVTGAEVRELLLRHRDQFSNLRPVPVDGAADIPAGVGSTLAAELSVEVLPEAIRALIARYEGAHPEDRLIPLHLAVTGSNEKPTLPGPGALPDEDHLVVLAITESVVGVEQAEVRSRVLYARRIPSGAE